MNPSTALLVERARMLQLWNNQVMVNSEWYKQENPVELPTYKSVWEPAN